MDIQDRRTELAVDFETQFRDNLPPYYDPKTQIFAPNRNLINNFQNPDHLNPDRIRAGIGVATTWQEPADNAPYINAEYVGSLFSVEGLDLMIRNVRSHPEITDIIVAGSNVNDKIASGSNALLDLKSKYDEIKVRNGDPEELIAYAIERGYKRLRPETLPEMWTFFELTTIHTQFFGSTNWDEINEYISALPEVDITGREPVFIPYTLEFKSGGWQESKSRLVVNGQRAKGIGELWISVLDQIRRYGVDTTKMSFDPEEDGRSKVVDRRGMEIILPVGLDPRHLPEEDLDILTQIGYGDQSTVDAYLPQFSGLVQVEGVLAIADLTEQARKADYIYGVILGPETYNWMDILADPAIESVVVPVDLIHDQQEINAKSPHCLTHVCIQRVGNEIRVYGDIRSNDMIGGWPINALGLLYHAHIIVEELNRRKLPDAPAFCLSDVRTFSYSAHFRDTGLDVAARMADFIVDRAAREVTGERVFVVVRRSLEDSTKVVVSFAEVEAEEEAGIIKVFEFRSLENVGKIINILVGEGLLVEADQIMRVSAALTHNFVTGDAVEFDIAVISGGDHVEASHRVKIKDEDAATIARKDLEHARAGLCNKMFKNPSGYVDHRGVPRIPYTTVTFDRGLENLILTSKPVLDDVAREEIRKVLRSNIFGKSAVWVGTSRIPYIQLLIDRESKINAHTIVNHLNPIQDLDEVMSITTKVMQEVLDIVRSFGDHPVATSDEILKNLRMGTVMLECYDVCLEMEDIKRAQFYAKNYGGIRSGDFYVPREVVYSDGSLDPRGNIIVNISSDGKKIYVQVDNKGTFDGPVSEIFTYKLDGLTTDLLVATRRVAGNIILDKGLFNNPTHIAYITKMVYLKLSEALKSQA